MRGKKIRPGDVVTFRRTGDTGVPMRIDAIEPGFLPQLPSI